MEKFDGENEKVPSVDHRLLFNSFYEVIGNIMSHCFVMVGYFPPRLQGKSHGYDMWRNDRHTCDEIVYFVCVCIDLRDNTVCIERQAIDTTTKDYTDLASHK